MKKSVWLRLIALGFIGLMGTVDAQGLIGGPKPVPTYCTECRPCSSNLDCGIDPINGIQAGVCWPHPHYPCSSGSTCSCR